MNVVTVTGHRPSGFGFPYDISHRRWDWLRAELERALVDELRVDKLLTGMALGTDQLAAEVASRNGVPYVAAVPFDGQESMWPQSGKRRYKELLDIADETIVVNPGPYAGWKMHARNQWMVDLSVATIACWNGQRHGGTWSCVEYALKKQGRVYRIDPITEKAGWEERR